MAERVWRGNDQLAPMLRPVGVLHTHERNPRRGDIEAIAASLQRFGQQRPILHDAGNSIVAGNHTYQAALTIGWTHIAATRSDLASAEEIERYLIADNRTSDLATYDNAELRALLEAQGTLDGTGYGDDDLEMLRAATRERPAAAAAASGAMRIILRYDEQTYREITARMDELMVEHGDDSYSDVVERQIGCST